MDQKLWAKQDWNFSVFGTKQKNKTIATDYVAVPDWPYPCAPKTN